MVIGVHFRIPGFGGGAKGVAVFFALSGYLVGSLLLDEHERTGSIDIGRFYGRRALRLLPAAALVVPVGVALGATLRKGLASLFYVSNFVERTGGPLAHFWSLAVEEHFYLVIPVLITVLARRRALLVATLCCAAASTLAFALSVRATPDGYFHTMARLPELLAGVLLAATAGWWRPRLARQPAIRGAIGSVGLTGLALILITDLPRLAGAPAAVTLLVIVGAPRVLEQSTLRLVGRMAYGLYLWHPIALYATGADRGLSTRTVVALVLTVILVAISHRYIEQPFREATDRSAALRTTAVLMVLSAAACVALSR